MQPDGYSSTFVPLVAFREYKSQWNVDPDLVVTEVRLGSSGTLTTAAGTLYTGPINSAIPGHPQIRTKLTRAQIEQRYPAHQGVAIGRIEPDGSRTFLTAGYLDKMSVHFGATPGDPPQAFWREQWRLTSSLAREATARNRTLQGQYHVSAALAQSLGDDWWDAGQTTAIDPGAVGEPISLVRALRLCFNPQGKPNRFRRPITMAVPGKYGHANSDLDLFVFCDVESPHAELWTYHQALQYLWYCAMVNAPTDHGNLFDMGAAINEGLGGTPTHRLTPDAVSGEPPGWLASMVRHCESLTPEGMTILDALKVLHQLCGVRYREVYETWNNTPVSRMRFWCPGDNTIPEVLEVEEDGSPFTPSGTLRDVETDLLHRNNLANARVLQDRSRMLNHAVTTGDRKYVALRMELMPLWLPDVMWDDQSEAAEELVDQAIGGADQDDFVLSRESYFFDLFHPEGCNWHNIDHSIIGRLWGMDFAAELDPADYNRVTGPYDDYGMVNWGALGTWAAPGAPTDLVLRRRRIMPLTATDASGRSVGVILEVSWDAGDTWHRIGSNEFRTIPERGAILISPQNLLAFGAGILKAMVEKTGSKPVRNYYHAYLLNYFRLRVTGLVDLDDRLVAEREGPWAGATGPLGPLTVSRMVLRGDEFRHVDTAWFTDHDYVGVGDVDDTAKAESYAGGVLGPHLGATRTASPVIPWLDLPARYPLGQPIKGISRSMVNNAHDLSFATAIDGTTELYPEVVGVIYRQTTKGASTELILEDWTYAGGGTQ